MSEATGAEPSRPMLRVVRGEPTGEELAALVTVLAARARAAAAAQEAARSAAVSRSRWADRPRGLRRPLRHGPDAWRASGRPG